MANSPWRIDGRVATLELPKFKAQLDLSRPDRGLRPQAWRGASVKTRAILGVVFPDIETDAATFDAYVRGDDLIVTYPETESRRFRVQAYWRCVTHAIEMEGLAIDLELSVQTRQWDCLPEVFTRTRLEDVETLQQLRMNQVRADQDSRVETELTAGGEAYSATVSDSAPGLQYVEMIHAHDLQSNRVEIVDKGWHLEHDLFEPGLERGVIRRVRVRGLFYAGAADDELVERAYRAFHEAPLPLTT